MSACMRLLGVALLCALFWPAGCQQAHREPWRLRDTSAYGQDGWGAAAGRPAADSAAADAPAAIPDARVSLRTEALRLFAERSDAIERKPLPPPDGYNYAWDEAYTQMGYVAAFEGTYDVKILRQLMRRIDAVLANRDDRRGVKDLVRGRPMPAWSSTHETNPRYAWAVHAGMITYPMARVAYLIKSNPRLKKDFDGNASQYEKAAIETVSAFDMAWVDGPGKDEGYYCLDGRDPKRAEVPLNCSNAMGRTLLMLYLSTGDEAYRQRVVKLANYLKRRMSRQDQEYVWQYWPARNSKVEDATHAGINVDFACECYRAGIVFSDEDMRSLVATFRRIARTDGFAEFVDGSGTTLPCRDGGQWLHLAYVDFRVAMRLLELVRDSRSALDVLTLGYLVEVSRPMTPHKPCAN